MRARPAVSHCIILCKLNIDSRVERSCEEGDAEETLQRPVDVRLRLFEDVPVEEG